MGRKEAIYRGIVIAALLLLLLSGLSSMAFAGKEGFALGTRAEDGDTLYVAIRQDISNLNYFDPNTDSRWKTEVLQWEWDSLMGYTPDLQLYMNLADSVSTDSSGLNVFVHIRQGIKFYDGVELTADDVVFTYEALAYNQIYHSDLDCLIWSSPQYSLWNGSGTSHVGVEKVDQYTVVFHLSDPYPLFYHKTLNVPIIPSHIWEKHTKPAGQPDSDDFILDYSYGKDISEVDATVGTGPFHVVDWQPGSRIVIERNDNYWGKGLAISWAGRTWTPFPRNVTRIVFKIYPNTGAALYALKTGAVHFIDWSVPPGYYNQLRTDPNIGSQVVDDQGFFYLAFNMRKAPENDLAFRTAVAHAIDKDYIVTTLMQGYGTKGTVPISITSGTYVNTSAIPPDFDLNAAKQVLDNAGYVDANGDGWRDAPDGTPIKETILTPPKDYDPIRAEAGIMIQNNLQSIGLNVISVPTDFDTLVGKAFIQVQFDMYILGWGVGSFPEFYLYDFFHSSQTAPEGYNTPGYSNPKVDQLLDAIRTEMDTQKRIQMVKDVEGILVHDLPYDTLYYRKSIMCYRKDIWKGWIPAFGTIFNIYSLSSIHRFKLDTSDAKISDREINGLVTKVFVSRYTYTSRELTGYVYTRDLNGYPVGNVTVAITLNGTEYVKFTTDHMGAARIRIHMDNWDIWSVNLTYSSYIRQPDGTLIFSNGTVPINVRPVRNVIILRYWSDSPVLNPGRFTTIHVVAEDRFGNPLPGVNVSAVAEYGELINAYAITGPDGSATLIYSAPTTLNITGMAIVDYVRISYEPLTGYVDPTVGTGYLPILVVSAEHDRWSIVRIESVSRFGITAGENSTITVRVTDDSGNPLSNVPVHIVAIYSTASDPNWYGEKAIVDTTNVTFDNTTKVTDTSGIVRFNLTAVNDVDKPYIIKVYTDSVTGICDAAQIYVGGTQPHVVKILNHTYTYDNGHVTWNNHTTWNNVTVGSDPLVGSWEIPYGMILHLGYLHTSSGGSMIASLEVHYALDVNYTVYNVTYNATSNTVENQTVVYQGYLAHAGDPAPNVLSFLAIYQSDYGRSADWISNNTYVWWAGQSFTSGYTDINGIFRNTLMTRAIPGDAPIYVSGWIDAFGNKMASPYIGLGFNLPYLFGAKSGFLLYRGPAMYLNISVDDYVLTEGKNRTYVRVHVSDEGGTPVVGATVYIKVSYADKYEVFSGTTNSTGWARVRIEVNGSYPYDAPVGVAIKVSEGNHVGTGYVGYTSLAWITSAYALGEDMGIDEINITSDLGTPYIVSDGFANITLRISHGYLGRHDADIEVIAVADEGTIDKNIKYTNTTGYVSFIYIPPNPADKTYYNITIVVINGSRVIQQTFQVAVFNENTIPEFPTFLPATLIAFSALAIALRRRR